MATEISKAAPPPAPAEWTVLPAKKLPEPTVWPAMLALAITFLVWGLVTSLIITGIGLVLFVISMAGWIRDIRHERKQR
jgi:hypothetical protein